MIILLAASIAYGLSRAVRIPALPLLVLAGIALGIISRTTQLPFSSGEVDALLQLGLAFMVFASGMELNPARVGTQRWPALRVGLAQFAAMTSLGLLLGFGLGFRSMELLYIALAISASSTIIVVRVLQQQQQLFEPFGRLVLGVLLLQDILVILCIGVLSGLDHGGFKGLLTSIVSIGLMVGCTYLMARWIAPWLILRLRLDQETMLLTAIAILFLFVGLAHAAGLPLPVGAFFAGVSLSVFPVNGVIRGPVASLSNFFLAVFFVSLGATLTPLGARDLALTAALTAVVVFVTPPLVVLLAGRIGLSMRSIITSGLLLAQCSEFSIVIMLLGRASGHVSDEVLSVVALVTVVSMMIASFIANDQMSRRLVRFHPSYRGASIKDDPPIDHFLLLGCGSNSRVLLDLLLLEGHRVIVVDEDPGVVKRLSARGVEVWRGDGGDAELLRALNARNARAIVSTVRRIEDNLRLLAELKDSGVPVFVRIFEETEARRIERAGGRAVLESHAAAENFVQWFASTARS